MYARISKLAVIFVLAGFTLLVPGAGPSEAGTSGLAAEQPRAQQNGPGWVVWLPLVSRALPAPVLSPITATSFDMYGVAWSAPEFGVSYTLQEAASAAFANPATVYTGFANTWQATGKAPGNYCYRVRASNQAATSPWSTARCITLPQLQDDFSVQANGWPVESDEVASMGYESGEYRVLAKQPNWVISGAPDVWAGDFRLEIDARSAGHTDGLYGVVFAATQTGYYLYEVGWGQFALFRYERPTKTWTALISPQANGAIRQGNQPNRLGVTHRGNTITLYANGVQVGGASDAVFGAGYVGVAVTGESDNYDVRFDNFVVAYAGGATGAAAGAADNSCSMRPSRLAQAVDGPRAAEGWNGPTRAD